MTYRVVRVPVTVDPFAFVGHMLHLFFAALQVKHAYPSARKRSVSNWQGLLGPHRSHGTSWREQLECQEVYISNYKTHRCEGVLQQPNLFLRERTSASQVDVLSTPELHWITSTWR